MAVSTTSLPPWSDLLPDLLGRVIAHLPFPANSARFRAVCRAWHSPYMFDIIWVETPCVITFTYVHPQSSHPRTSAPPILVKYRHTYSLHNPFSGETVPLPELDSIVGHVAETFEIRKVLMRSASSPDVIAVTTNNSDYPVILCKQGSCCVLPYLRVFDVAFFAGKLYGITPDADLVAFDLTIDHKDDIVINGYKRVIAHPLPEDDDEEEDLWSFMDEYCHVNVDGGDDDQEEDKADYDSSSDDMVPNGKEIVRDNEVPYEPKDFITTTLHLVRSCGGELLLVRHRYQSPSLLTCRPYTRNVELFKADVDAGNWIPVTADGLAQGEALFLSRSFSNSTRGYGDTHEGFVHFVEVEDAFDTRSWTRRQFSLPRERNLVDDDLLTWVFPPQVVL
ncbi:hypothetical protein EJB05_10328, partial [Eragrostis curvula]